MSSLQEGDSAHEVQSYRQYYFSPETQYTPRYRDGRARDMGRGTQRFLSPLHHVKAYEGGFLARSKSSSSYVGFDTFIRIAVQSKTLPVPVGTTPSPALWALKGTQKSRAPTVTIRSEDRESDAHRRLLCAQCKALITDRKTQIEAAGSHEHTCTNPHGFAYRIGCFAAAPGCIAIGRAESYWSWFPGYSWQLVLCRACHAHLGWHFRAASSAFYGLILDRLIPET